MHEGVIYKCDQCDYRVRDRENLKNHKQSKHEGFVFWCGQCDYKASHKGNLKKHYQTKHEESTKKGSGH